MSRTQEMATILMDWYAKLQKDSIKNPIARIEAIEATRGRPNLDRIDIIINKFPEALELFVGRPSYLIIEHSVDGLYAVSEMRYQSQSNAGEHYLRIHTVGGLNAFDAMINIKQRYDWEIANGH